MKHGRNSREIVCAMTGASGAILGLRIMELLHSMKEIFVHCIVSTNGRRVLDHETVDGFERVRALADAFHAVDDMDAPIASGSYRHDGMLIVPCSIKTLSAIANCYADTLVTRAADVSLKERRPLLLAVRETPLHAGHLHTMETAARLGALIFPPLPPFYLGCTSIQELLDQLAGRMLASIGIENSLAVPWHKGPASTGIARRDP